MHSGDSKHTIVRLGAHNYAIFDLGNVGEYISANILSASQTVTAAEASVKDDGW